MIEQGTIPEHSSLIHRRLQSEPWFICQVRVWVREARQGAFSVALHGDEKTPEGPVSTKHGATQAPCCPRYRHTEKSTAWVHLQSFLDMWTAGVTARAQGTTRPGCPRTMWVQPRTGPRAREETLGTSGPQVSGGPLKTQSTQPCWCGEAQGAPR